MSRFKRIVEHASRELWILRLVSVIISILLWITVMGGKRHELSKVVNLDYQLPPSLLIANQVPREVTYRVVGPRAFLNEFQDKPVSISLDLTRARVGDYEIVLREDMLDIPLGLKVASISQSVISVKLDKPATKRVPVRAVFSGMLPEGSKVKNITLKPSTVEITGAASRLNTIDNVPTEPIPLVTSGLKQKFDVSLDITDVPSVTLADNDKTVDVLVEIDGTMISRWFRNLPVQVRVGTGVNAKAVDPVSLGIFLYPKVINILVEGQQAMIEEMKDFDIAVWAEVPALKKGKFKAPLGWTLSPDVRVVRRSADSIEVTVPAL